MIFLRPNQSERGSVLMVSVMTTAIMGIMLAAYLDLVSAQNLAVARSQAWNAAIPTLEGGVEEALAQLNQNGVNNLSADGWDQNGIQFSKFRAFGDSHVFVVISNVNPPVIYAFGYVPVPLQNSNYVQRVVRVQTTRNGLFTKALLSQNQITMNGDAQFDSYDSTDPLYSTNGGYVSGHRKAGAGVASNSGLTNILVTGNSVIYGNLDTGPGGTIGIGPNGKVGDLAWIASAFTSGIQPSAARNDMNVSFPDAAAPFSSAVAPSGGSGYQYVFSSSGNYELPSVTGSLWIQSNVNAVVLIDGNMNIKGNDLIQIDPGGSLQIYMAGASASIGGNGVANNNTYATNFFYWGLPSNSQLSVSGNGQFTGVVYAPAANFVLNGGGYTQRIVGAIVANTAQINGHFHMHYDESLGRLVYGKGVIASSWDEL